ncbi:hypothetical protein GGI07_002307 [Coemansia sp. Benny D115]|nr:hypothetical protein GGI07_002307 [Coemansia sp. Benny D115]
MSEYLSGIRMVYSLPEEEEAFGAEELFPFDQIGNFRSVQEIPRYNFELERRVKQEVVEFRDEMTVRTMHLEHQRRPARHKAQSVQPLSAPQQMETGRRESAVREPQMLRAHSTPVGAIVDLTQEYEPDVPKEPAQHQQHVHVLSPDMIKTRLPAIKKKEEPRPTTSRLKGLFRSKTRSPKA